MWGPVVVGVDASSEAADAARLGYRIARGAAASCDLIHAAPDPSASHRVTKALRGKVPPELVERLETRGGRPARVLQQAAEERGAGLLVLGGKHHTALERWLGGSTSLAVLRTTEVPILIAAGAPTSIRRVLVAVDLSEAARPTLGLAERFARAVGAQLRVVTVFEPPPALPDVPPLDPVTFYALSQELLQRDIWPLIRIRESEKIVRHGLVVETLRREATDWSADVLVVGSHGKGWAERVLLGSVTERLLNDLPTSLLIAPVGVATPVSRPHAAEAVPA